ncbi:MAG: hypothetical protein SNJ55_01865 [Chloroherpetonaceae bacterium]
MITLEEVKAMGINAPIEHQRVIAKLIARLGTMYYDLKTIALEPLPKTMLDETKTSPVPDVMLCDHERETVPVIIEVTRTRTVHADMKKITTLIMTGDFGIDEGFVYDYKKNEWHKYKKGIGVVAENPSFFETLHLDLATLV